MDKIFISYRREDAADVTGRINDRLRQHYGEEAIFTDVDNIPFGVDFRAYLDREVSHCRILLTVIGRNWLTVKNDKGQPRLHDPSDFVRIEIESALRRNIPVVPLLVHGTIMPAADELPEALQELTFRNGIPIRPDPDFHKDMDRLINGLDQHLHARQETEKGKSQKATEGEPPGPQKSKEGEGRKPETQPRKATTARAPRHAADRQMQPEFWKCLLTNIAGVAVGLVPGITLASLLMDPLYDSLGGDEMVATLILFTVGGASVGAMQSLRLRHYIPDVGRWARVSVLGWMASGALAGLLLMNVNVGWVTLMIFLPLAGGALTATFQTPILRTISSRANFWWLASALAWPVGAVIGRIFGDPPEATILLVPFGGLVCWLIVTAATMAWLLTSAHNDATE